VLYPPQIHAIESGATLDNDIVISLPTSSGKTLVAELRVAATLARSPGSRVIYVAPYRLLARQVQRSFELGLRPLGHTVGDLGRGFDGSLDADGFGEHGLPSVAICTPERLDALMRSASTPGEDGLRAAELFESCSLLVFDELQLLGRPVRGLRFELLLSRFRSRFPSTRVLGLSASSGNINRLANWLTQRNAVVGARRPTGTLELVWRVDGAVQQRVGDRVNLVTRLPRTNRAVDDAARLILRLRADHWPALAVEVNRQSAERLASKIVELSPADSAAWRSGLAPAGLTKVDEAVEEIRILLGSDHPLGRCVAAGVAFHHAGVPTHILRQVESLSAERLLRVACSTTTVAEGADLPFRVVFIPHLNFPGSSRVLERDLYMNIIGRAGRANVSVEGIVFVVDSGAPTLKRIIAERLWTDRAEPVSGQMLTNRPAVRPASLDTIRDRDEVTSHVLGWLGDGDSYYDQQASRLASKTFSWATSSSRERQQLVRMIDESLVDLDRRRFALAASPYRLTGRGERARQTGLSVSTFERLERTFSRQPDWVGALGRDLTLAGDSARIVARLIFESTEAIQCGLWMRSQGSETDQLRALEDLTSGARTWPTNDRLFQADVGLLRGWLLGHSYGQLAAEAPMLGHASRLFGGTEVPKRTSDATEYIGKLGYPATWVWSGARIVGRPATDAWPSYIRGCIEYGVPTEAGVRLIEEGRVSRATALSLGALCGPGWTDTVEWLIERGEAQMGPAGVSTADRLRLLRLRDRLIAGG